MFISISLDSLPQKKNSFLLSCKNDLVRDTSCLRFPSCMMQRELLNQTLVKFPITGGLSSQPSPISTRTRPRPSWVSSRGLSSAVRKDPIPAPF